MSLLNEFIAAFQVWEEAIPFLPWMVEEGEMELVVTISQGADPALTVERVADLLGLNYSQADELIQRAYSRCILNKVVEDGVTKYSPADFYNRLDHFAKYENWGDIPYDDRQIINRSFLDQFIQRHKANLDRKMRGLEAENALPNDTVMLLSEVEEMIEAATDIVVQPCDCRKLGENCEKPVETCIWLDEGARASLDRGHGRRLTKDEAIELLRWTDKKGLMHTADSAWQKRGLHAICNCCACDCYPFRAAQELGTKGVWPKSYFVAEHDTALCNLCGSCVKRCHFDAFFLIDEIRIVGQKQKQVVELDPVLCWGCGLCANTCPEGAISMISV
jgi:ferredoxin